MFLQKYSLHHNSKAWLIVGIFAVVLIHLQSIFNGFTNWDDLQQVTENPDIKHFSANTFQTIFSSFYVGMYQPLATLCYALIFAIAGLKPWAFHLFGVLLHTANVYLVYLLIRKINTNSLLALFAAMLFALTPVQTEAIAWVSATSTLLFSFFMLLSILQYIGFQENKKSKNYYFSLFFFLLSLLSKSAAVILPLLLILLDYRFNKRFDIKKLLNKIPFLLLSLGFGIIAIVARQQSGHIAAMSEHFSIFNRIVLVLYSLSFYIISPLLPLKLSAFHPYPAQVAGTLPFLYYLTPLLIIALIILVFRAKQNKQEYIFGFAFFLINMIIMLELIPVGVQVVKERYTYLASIGLFYNLGALLLYFQSKGLQFKNLLLYVGTAIIIAFSIITSLRIHTWKNSFTLWNDVILKYPKTSAAYINRGNAYAVVNNFEKAIQDYTSAIAYEPNAADAYTNRAVALSKTGDLAGAIKDYNKAIAISPADADMYAERAALKSGLNDVEGAIADLTKAIALKPTDETFYNKRGIIYGMVGYTDKALVDFNNSIQQNPEFAEAYSNRGYLYLNTGKYSDAIKDLDKSLTINSKSAQTFYIRGLAHIAKGDTLKACNDFKQAEQLGINAAVEMITKYCK